MPSFDLVLTDNFPILSLTLVTEPLRLANREAGEKTWRWRFLSIAGGPVLSSSGMQVSTDALDNRKSDVVLLLSSYHPEVSSTPKLFRWLKARARQGAMMGCVDTGALIFAQAGLLSRTPAAAHFEALRGFQEDHEREMFVDRLFDLSDNRCSSAGGVATFDMTLGLIERFGSPDLAARVAEILTYRPTSYDGPQQRLLTNTSLARVDRNLARSVELMLATLDQPLQVTEIAERVGVPPWTLARLFKRHLKQSPAKYYRSLRLAEARNLLDNSSLRIGDIAAICGFENPETFTRSYREEFGCSPSQYRSR
jgi:AraC family carnitine catabolism transcriptional activator